MRPLRSLVRYALVLGLMASTQGLVLTQMAFTLNQDVIVERYCVNRALPELACEGSCFLEEMMQRRKDEERRATFLEVALAFTLLVPTAAALDAPPPTAAPAPTPGDPAFSPQHPVFRVFHPPRTA